MLQITVVIQFDWSDNSTLDSGLKYYAALLPSGKYWGGSSPSPSPPPLSYTYAVVCLFSLMFGTFYCRMSALRVLEVSQQPRSQAEQVCPLSVFQRVKDLVYV